MTAFQRNVILLLCFSLCAGCATQQQLASKSKRNPAQIGSEDSSPPPPLAKPMDMWAYSWTDRSDAISNPPGFVASALARGSDCVDKLAKSQQEVTGCEGNEMAAGPGLYTTDNPFTSHDYGSTAVIVRIRAQGGPIGMATGRFTDRMGGVDREAYANPKYAGLLYDFRPSDLNTRALVLRNASAVDVAASSSITVRPTSYKVMGAHEMFVCSNTSSLNDVVQHWGDHFEFLSLVFDFSGDPENANYLSGGKPNAAGFAAAIASDAVAADDAALNSRLSALKAKFPDIKESLSKASCHETSTNTTRSCVAHRVFDSLLNNQGTPNRPTYAWKLNDLKQALLILKVAGAKDVNARSSDELMKKMVASYADVSPKVLTAYGCMLAIRSGVVRTHFGLWGDDPQF